MINQSFQIITTLGPSSRTVEKVKKLKQAGASCFRINLSHASIEQLNLYFNLCKEADVIPSLDTQGGQVRISSVPKKSHYKKGDSLIISCQEDMPKSAEYDFIINHPESLKQINAGDILKIGFDGLTAKVLKLEESSRTLHSIVLSSGNIGVNKAIDVSNKSINLVPLTCLDKLAFAEQGQEIQSIFIIL